MTPTLGVGVIFVFGYCRALPPKELNAMEAKTVNFIGMARSSADDLANHDPTAISVQSGWWYSSRWGNPIGTNKVCCLTIGPQWRYASLNLRSRTEDILPRTYVIRTSVTVGLMSSSSFMHCGVTASLDVYLGPSLSTPGTVNASIQRTNPYRTTPNHDIKGVHSCPVIMT